MPYLGDDDVFALTYGDGVADIDLQAELEFHRRAQTPRYCQAAVRPAKRFGVIELSEEIRR